VGVAAAADSRVDGWQVCTGVGKAETKAEVLDHRLDLFGGIYFQRFFAPPFAVAVLFYLFGKLLHQVILTAEHAEDAEHKNGRPKTDRP